MGQAPKSNQSTLPITDFFLLLFLTPLIVQDWEELQGLGPWISPSAMLGVLVTWH